MGTTLGVIYVDVSEWFRSKSSTGIQRVLRETVDGLRCAIGSENVIPVIADCGKFYGLNNTEYDELRAHFQGTSNCIENKLFPSFFSSLKAVLRQNRHVMALASAMWGARAMIEIKAKRLLGNPSRSTPIQVSQSDVLLMIDAFWSANVDIMPAVKWYKKGRGKVVLLVHDLIPLMRRPQTNYLEMQVFKHRLISLAKLSDQNLVVSKEQLKNIAEHLPSVEAGKFEVVYLGADGPRLSERLGQLAQKTLQRSASTLLMVGTLSERKNHNIVLDAFDRLYAAGRTDLQLVIAGDSAPATGRIRMILKGSVPKPPYLTVLNKVSDETLAQLYRQASACIFASADEGFGLPLWEAQYFQTPVIASDIPVFRELGNQNVTFFECGNSAHLAEVIDKHQYSFLDVQMRSWRNFSDDLVSVIQSLWAKPAA